MLRSSLLLALALAAACGSEDDMPAMTASAASSWTVRPTGTLSDLESAAFGGAFVAVGKGGVIMRSLDGVTWKAMESTTSSDLASVTFAASRYVAVGSAGTILTSPTGEFWTKADAGTKETFYAVAFAYNEYVI